MPTIAYSYIRFSSAQQAKSSSLRRQYRETKRICNEKGWTLDKSFTFHDLGVSAYRGKHKKLGKLKLFFEAVESGQIKKGSVLVVESLDRLSREEINMALSQFMEILNAGIKIQTLEPERLYTKKVLEDASSLLEPLFIMQRAREESTTKGYRVGRAWELKREAIANGSRRPTTALCPAWLRVSDDKKVYVPIPKAVDAIRLIFELAIDGYGGIKICKYMNEHVEPIGKVNSWHRSYIQKLLNNRQLLGEYQPHKMIDGKRQAEGESIKGYFPEVIEEHTFYLAQAALASRKGKQGRAGKNVPNLFRKLLIDARDHEPIVYVNKGAKSKPKLVNAGAKRGIKNAVEYIGFTYKEFEHSFLHFISDLNPKDLQKTKSVPEHLKTEKERLEGEVAKLKSKVRTLKKKMVEFDDIDSLFDVLRSAELKLKSQQQTLNAVRQRFAVEQNDTLVECHSIIELIERAEGEELFRLRTKLSSPISELVESFYLLIWKTGPTSRSLKAQVHLKDGNHAFFSIVEGFGALGGKHTIKKVIKPEWDLRQVKNKRKLISQHTIGAA